MLDILFQKAEAGWHMRLHHCKAMGIACKRVSSPLSLTMHPFRGISRPYNILPTNCQILIQYFLGIMKAVSIFSMPIFV